MVRCSSCLDDIPKEANFCPVCGVPLHAFPKLQENHIPQLVPPPEKPSTSGSELEPEAAAKEELKTQEAANAAFPQLPENHIPQQEPPPEESQPLLARNNQPEVKAMPQPLLAESNRPEVKAMPKPSASGSELEPEHPSDSQEVDQNVLKEWFGLEHTPERGLELCRRTSTEPPQPVPEVQHPQKLEAVTIGPENLHSPAAKEELKNQEAANAELKMENNELKGTKMEPNHSQEGEPIPRPKPPASGCVSAEVDDAALAVSANKDADADADADALTTVNLRVVDPMHRLPLFKDQLDAWKECEYVGEIKEFKADPAASDASVLVTFSKAEEARICVQKMDGRRFDDKQLRATLHPASSPSGPEFEQEKGLKGTKRKIDPNMHPNDLQDEE